jgi:hypothetical protein
MIREAIPPPKLRGRRVSNGLKHGGEAEMKTAKIKEARRTPFPTLQIQSPDLVASRTTARE